MRCNFRLRFGAILCAVVASFLPPVSSAQGTVKSNRDLMRMIAQGVADIIDKNFYDPKLKGVDWKAEQEETKKKIAASEKVGEMYAAIDAMVRKIDDSHTRFLPPWQTQEPRFGLQMKPFGEQVRIWRIKENGPAAKAGLQLGDTVLAINGIVADRKHYFETQYFYKLLRPAGTMVLDIVRDGNRQRVTIQADIHTRFGVEVVGDTYRWYDYVREEETDYNENPYRYQRGDVGVVKIPEFRFDHDLAEQALVKVKGSSAVIVDLRGNLGGDVLELERFTGHFHKEETEIFKALERERQEVIKSKPQQPSFADVPVVVLVDSESASASELFARHMQLSGRATIIGDKTMGAVSMAQIYRQKIGASPVVFYGAQTTIGRAVFPDGQDLEKVGVTPDNLCIPSAFALASKKDPCLELAISVLKTKLSEKKAGSAVRQLPVSTASGDGTHPAAN